MYTISNVFDEPQLIQALARIVPRQDTPFSRAGKTDSNINTPGSHDSVLFLRIQAAAEYFSPNQTLMQHPPAVDVDIVLDPYIASIFPQSLVSTAVYLVVLATLAWVVSKLIWSHLKSAGIKVHTD